MKATKNKPNGLKAGWLNTMPSCMIFNLLLVLVCYLVCRVAFYLENSDIFGSFTLDQTLKILEGGWYFDLSAILYTNAVYLLIVLFPLHLKETVTVRKITKWIFVVINSLAIIANLVDSVYFQYTQRRTTILVFEEFGNENNLGAIVSAELVNHWYFFILAAALVFFLWKCYRENLTPVKPLKFYYIRQSICLVVFVPLILCGMRGALFTTSTRPISVAFAHQFVNTPVETGLVLNTPFTLIRTTATGKVNIPRFFDDKAEMEAIYNPIHTPAGNVAPDKKNIVILIVESFAQEFIGGLNRDLDNGTYKGYTEFTDSLLPHSLTFKESFCNGWVSIDGMPAVLASIPKMYNAFILSPYSTNDVSGIAKILGDWGYSSAFFHGGNNSSMGFQAFAKAAGFDEYYGRNEYEKDPRFGGPADFDGTWAIWDEEFLQFYCAKMSEMQQPFVTSVFTASSHHPFAIPERYKDIYKDEGIHKLHKCIRYTDNALRRFFDEAKKQPWYDNTIFVITADHASSKTTHDEYKTELGHFRVPIIFFDPSGKMPVGMRDGIAQHIDIMPTLLSYVGYDKPYFAYGIDLLTTPADGTWAMNWHNLPQFIMGDYLLQFDGFKITGLYDYKNDKLLRENLVGKYPEIESQMAERLEAFMQTYSETMKENNVRIK